MTLYISGCYNCFNLLPLLLVHAGRVFMKIKVNQHFFYYSLSPRLVTQRFHKGIAAAVMFSFVLGFNCTVQLRCYSVVFSVEELHIADNILMLRIAILENGNMLKRYIIDNPMIVLPMVIKLAYWHKMHTFDENYITLFFAIVNADF